MELHFPSNSTALRLDNTLRHYSVRLDPKAFRNLLQYVERGREMQRVKSEFTDNVSSEAFTELVPTDPQIYDAFKICFDNSASHCEDFRRSLGDLRYLGYHLSNLAEHGMHFIRESRQLMRPESTVELAFELSMLCRGFNDECRTFENNYLSPLFDEVVKFRVLSSQDNDRVKQLNKRWDSNFPSESSMHEKAQAKVLEFLEFQSANEPRVTVFDRIFTPGYVRDEEYNYKRKMEDRGREVEYWLNQLKSAYEAFQKVDKTIDMAVDGASGSETGLLQLKSTIGSIISDCEDYYGAIDRVIERTQTEDGNIGDLDVFMTISGSDMDSAKESWSSLRSVGEELNGALTPNYE